ncbi:hypothetical protein BN1013_00934 [Candidatus Rubidus massiliensis]|nr:MAG: hypothetical protein BGO10_06940 [Chlamydia sp. 32-24]CDZ80422.1 hypothetical protein BN1013_00934 [Candidatus Rubidus massiliensis]
MKKNIGTTDRVTRAILAIILLFLAFWYHSWILAIFGLFTLYEALASWCIFYQLIGKNSCPVNIEKRSKDDKHQ